MTGFGRAEAVIAHTQFTFEIRSVNHRYLDARFRLPFPYNPLEPSLVELLRQHFERGSFEIHLKTKLLPQAGALPPATQFIVDEGAAQSLYEACELLKK